MGIFWRHVEPLGNGAIHAIFFGTVIELTVNCAFSQTFTLDDIRTQQEMLIWTTDYDGLIDGKIGPETTQGIKQFQIRLGNPPTGRLSAAEYQELQKQGNAKRDRAGFQQVIDKNAGVSVGIPLKLVS